MTNQSDKKGVGVIVGRFQTPVLHPGHELLLRTALSANELTIIFIGVPGTPMTKDNPLDFGIRKKIIENWIKKNNFSLSEVDIVLIHDHSSDHTWSQNLDDLIDKKIDLAIYEGISLTNRDVTLYHGRDSFRERYHGKHTKFQETDSIHSCSATKTRKEIGKSPSLYSIVENKTAQEVESIASGIIWTAENMFPRVQPTVDIAPILATPEGLKVLLGQKPGSDKYCFIGGFIDMTDETGEQAACRELKEETNIDCNPGQLMYVSQHKINDWRDSSSTSVMTTFYLTYLSKEQCVDIKPQDDIESLRWFMLDELKEDMISNQHKILFKKLMERYQV